MKKDKRRCDGGRRKTLQHTYNSDWILAINLSDTSDLISMSRDYNKHIVVWKKVGLKIAAKNASRLGSRF